MYTGYGYHASATVGSAIGIWIKGWGNQLPGTFTTHYGIKIDAISGASTNYAILTTSGLVVINESGADSDTRIEGDTDANLVFVDASADKVAVGASDPQSKLDINSDTIRLRTAKTPASASDTGVTGQICWDADYIYICTATNTWKRAAIATW
jgi:hypothetical protein